MKKLLRLWAIATVMFVIQWVVASLFVFLGLNFIGEFDFSFSEIIGIGYVAAALLPIKTN